MIRINVKCRHGVEYSTRVAGTWGEISRTERMLANCCCYVCYNHDCKQAVLGKQQCREECTLFVNEPYCTDTHARVK